MLTLAGLPGLRAVCSRIKAITRPPNSRFPGAEAVERALREHQQVGLIYLDIVKFHEVEQLAGRQACARILRLLQTIVPKAATVIIDSRYLLGAHNINGDDFVVFFISNQRTAVSILDIRQLAQQVAQLVKQRLRDHLRSHWPELDLHVGYTLIKPSSLHSLESQLYTSIKEALLVAKGQVDLDSIQKDHELREIIANKSLRVVFQPLVSLLTGEIIGYEALTRGPAGSYFASPANLFPFAQATRKLLPAEKLARELAIAKLPDFGPGQKLFLNINPQVVEDPAFAAGETRRMLASVSFACQNVVFEITERTSIDNYPQFAQALEHYRNQGYLIAVDDAGAGYSSLQSIAELQPDYIKIDMSLVRGIDSSSTKQALLETFVLFSQRINAQIIAEGIETEAELHTLIKLGVPLGQGYLLARPAYPLPPVTPQVRARLSIPNQKSNRSSAQGITIGSIASKGLVLNSAEPSKRAAQLFEENPTFNSITIIQDGNAQGLIMRDKLYYHLACQYGMPLYWDRPVTHLMDGNPLMVDKSIPVDAVSRRATDRSPRNLYDDILVVDHDALVGSVSVRQLLDAITQLQVEAARGANPLTGLPGNRRIEEAIQLLLAVQSEPFALIYADLDWFKAFNDRYGFERGDHVILLAARILSQAVAQYGNLNDFVGHIGGDDFALIIHDARRAQVICQQVIEQFDQQITCLYDQVDLAAGGIATLDRDGQQHFYPLMTISLAIVTNEHRNCTSHLAMAEVAAELKCHAKAKSGSAYVAERRQ